jgi:Zn-finger domain-containing protein
MDKHKDTIDISYEQIRDNIFKLKEIEKNKITDRLKSLTDESRDLDTMLKINKLGVWGKGLQKGLTVYDKEAYEEEEDFRDEMEKAERNIRKKNSNVTNDNIDQFLDDYLDEQREGEDIEREAYDLEYLNEDFDDGNFNGYAAPEEEADDYTEYE